MRMLASLTLACIAIASTAAAAGVAPQSGYSGSTDFQAYCASCHGTTAKGDGALAKSLPKRPPDLTQLAKRNNDVFPEARVFKTIDGRSPGSSHSGADMPMWGDVFAKSADSIGPEATAARITALVKYLDTIQEKR
jgi:mono/diheme cytochrome c family protein